MGEGTSHALGCALGGTWPGAQGPIRVVRTEARLRAVGREQVSRSRTASRALGGGGGQMQKPRAYGAGRGHWAALCSVELVVLCLVDGGLSRSGPCPEAARGSVALTRSFDARGLQAPTPPRRVPRAPMSSPPELSWSRPSPSRPLGGGSDPCAAACGPQAPSSPREHSHLPGLSARGFRVGQVGGSWRRPAPRQAGSAAGLPWREDVRREDGVPPGVPRISPSLSPGRPGPAPGTLAEPCPAGAAASPAGGRLAPPDPLSAVAVGVGVSSRVNKMYIS